MILLSRVVLHNNSVGVYRAGVWSLRKITPSLCRRYSLERMQTNFASLAPSLWRSSFRASRHEICVLASFPITLLCTHDLGQYTLQTHCLLCVHDSSRPTAAHATTTRPQVVQQYKEEKDKAKTGGAGTIANE